MLEFLSTLTASILVAMGVGQAYLAPDEVFMDLEIPEQEEAETHIGTAEYFENSPTFYRSGQKVHVEGEEETQEIDSEEEPEPLPLQQHDDLVEEIEKEEEQVQEIEEEIKEMAEETEEVKQAAPEQFSFLRTLISGALYTAITIMILGGVTIGIGKLRKR